MNAAATPTPVEDVQGDGRWMSIHNRFITEAKEREPEVLFVGDSLLTHLQFTDLWDRMFVPLHCLNFGIGGDQTQHILWRMQNGELENLSPKLVVLLAGTNNHGHTAEMVVGGILEIVRTIHEKQPQAQIVVMGIPPRGQSHNPLRDKIAKINQCLSEKLPEMENSQFLNIDPNMFLNPIDGTISHQDMYDYLHLTKRGYQKLVDPLLDEVQTILKNFLKADSASCGDPDM